MSDASRADVARRLARALRRPQRQVGERALGRFVIALPEDSVGYVCQRVEAAGGTANVVMALGQGLHVFNWSQVDVSDTPLFATIASQTVSTASPMAMVLQLVTSVSEPGLAFSVEHHCRVNVSDGDLLLAPA